MSDDKTFKCPISGEVLPMNKGVPANVIRTELIDMLRKRIPGLSERQYISIDGISQLRMEHVRSLLETDKGELNRLEQEVVDSLRENELMARNVDEEFDDTLTFGQRLADKIAEFGGSWRFIIMFGLFITLWIGLNIFILASKAYDPYPFILLNLILSCLAALQAPVIMMSQNRMEAKDRKRAANDYQVNLKAELEIRQLHEKIDHLITKQMQHLNEIQEIQLEMLQEIAKRKEE